jgi:hypothetical protein
MGNGEVRDVQSGIDVERSDSGVSEKLARFKGKRGSAHGKRRPRTEPPWPVTISDGNWYNCYPKCLANTADGEFSCKRRPISRGNFYCGTHGGYAPQVIQRAKERHLMWLLLGEPFVHPDAFDTFVTMFLKRMLDRIVIMRPKDQMRLLEIAVDLVNGGDGVVSKQ